MSGTNTYTGRTFVSSGILIATSPAAIADGTNLTVGAAETLLFATSIVPPAENAIVVPESSTLSLDAAGALAVFGQQWRRRSQSSILTSSINSTV